MDRVDICLYEVILNSWWKNDLITGLIEAKRLSTLKSRMKDQANLDQSSARRAVLIRELFGCLCDINKANNEQHKDVFWFLLIPRGVLRYSSK